MGGSNMNCREILQTWLIAGGFDGLQHDSDCGCKIDDLIPCDQDCSECTPGYLRLGKEGEECDWYIVPKKPSALQPSHAQDSGGEACYICGRKNGHEDFCSKGK